MKPSLAALVAISVLANVLLAGYLWFGKPSVEVSTGAGDLVVMR